MLSRVLSVLAFIVLAPVASAADAIEGVYQARADGYDTYVTIVRVSPEEIAVTVGFAFGAFGMSYTTYRGADGTYEVHRFPAGVVTGLTDYYMTFSVDEATGELNGHLQTGARYMTVRGFKVDTYVDYLGDVGVAPVPGDIVGRFEGRGWSETLRIDIMRTAVGLRGLATFNPGRSYQVGVYLESVYYDAAKQVVYMTMRDPGNGGNGSINQVRAKLDGEELTGYYIVGGQAHSEPFHAIRSQQTTTRSRDHRPGR